MWIALVYKVFLGLDKCATQDDGNSPIVSHARWTLWLKSWDCGGNNSENLKINCHQAQCQLVKWNKTLENMHIALSYESIIVLCFAAIFGAPTISCDSLHHPLQHPLPLRLLATITDVLPCNANGRERGGQSSKTMWVLV